MDRVVATHYPDVPTSKLVRDNYGIHPYGAFYEQLPVERARQLRHQLAFHFTPKHGSWLNRAEIEFPTLSRQCLDRRIGRARQLEEEARIWQAHRNAAATKVNWSFTTEKARDTLKNRYVDLNKEKLKTKLADYWPLYSKPRASSSGTIQLDQRSRPKSLYLLRLQLQKIAPCLYLWPHQLLTGFCYDFARR